MPKFAGRVHNDLVARYCDMATFFNYVGKPAKHFDIHFFIGKCA